MLISDKKNFIFVHIYKTAGSSITRLLGPHVEERYRAKVPLIEGDGWQETWHYRCRQHAKLEELRTDPAWQGRDLTKYRICTVVRNPYTWALSVWNDFYRREADAPLWFTTLYPSRTFLEYCRVIQAAARGLAPEIWGSSPQLSFIADLELKPTFVARFERLSQDVRNMLEFLDIAFDGMPHDIYNNPDERSDVLTFFNEESLSIIKALLAKRNDLA